jgi:hypothetical protein
MRPRLLAIYIDRFILSIITPVRWLAAKEARETFIKAGVAARLMKI